MEHDERSGIRPTTDLVLVESDRRRWRELLSGSTAAYRGKLLSELIVLTDDGPFSHVVFHRSDSVLDARLPTGQPPRSVTIWPFAALVELPRDRSRFRMADGDLSPAWDAVVEQSWFGATLDGDAPDLPAEIDVFTYAGLVLVALNLATTEWRIFRPLGRLLLRRHRDYPGFFCSELIAKAMVDAGLPLDVVVRAARVPSAGTRAEKAVLDLLVARESAPAGSWPSIAAQVPREQIRAQLASLREITSITGEIIVPVGSGTGAMPPSLVTPNDLLRSPSFGFVRNEPTRGSPADETPPRFTRAERRARFIRYLGAVALVPVNSVLARRGRQ